MFYNGFWANDMKNGDGNYQSVLGANYNGFYLNGKIHREGLLVTKNKDQYCGQIDQGKI